MPPSNTGSSSKSDKSVMKSRDKKTIPPYEYVCTPRPQFDWEAEHQAIQEDDEEEDEEEDEEDEKEGMYFESIAAEEATGIYFQPATEHAERKWVMLWEAWTRLDNSRQRVDFCDPDAFGMYIYNDWKGYGVTAILEDLLVAFDAARKKKEENNHVQAWAIVSSLAYWLNDGRGGGLDFISTDDGERAHALSKLAGCALLTALAMVETAGELNPESKLVDLPIVISAFLAWSEGLDSYGIEDDATSWRSKAVNYFKKAALDPSKGIFKTATLLEEAADGDDEAIPSTTKKDPWAWAKELKQYKNIYGPKIGGTHYDITKMSRAERANYAYDGKDPLADIPLADIRRVIWRWARSLWQAFQFRGFRTKYMSLQSRAGYNRKNYPHMLH